MSRSVPPGETRPPLRVVWAVFFAYGVAAAALVQLVLLPHIIPAWHGGEGLLAGGDWLTFHSYAAGLAERIRAEGWTAWELRPAGMAPIGIAGAVYALTVPRPWTLIPLNAALHATAAILLLRLIELLLPDRRRALLAVLPYLLYPTTLLWVSQFHKDGMFDLGYAALLYGWATLAAVALRNGTGAAGAVAALGAGSVLIWVMRPEHVWPLQGLGLVPVVIALGAWLGPMARGVRPRARVAVVLGLLGAAVLLPAWLAAHTPAARRVQAGTPGRVRPMPVEPADGRWTDPVPQRGVRALAWYRTPGVPAAVEGVAYRLALIREQFLFSYLDARSNIDVDVGMRSVPDLVRRLPRALQIALWAPFPRQWLQADGPAWTGASRGLVSLEMLGVYLALLGLPAAIWRWGRRPALWSVVLGCLLPLALYGLTIPNLGALHRFRYPFLMPLVALGLAGTLAGWRRPRAA